MNRQYNIQPVDIVILHRSNLKLVDSRIVAKGLRISHNNFFKTILKYRNEIESRIGTLAFETQVLKHVGSSGSSLQKFCYLTEPQANFVISLSRNRPEVVEFKLALVQAFEKAKQLLQEKQITSVSPIKQRWLDNAGQVPIGYFSMIFEAVSLFALPLENKCGYSLPENILIDVSLGKGFCSFLRSRGIEPEVICLKYIHRLPSGRSVMANAYPIKYYNLFYDWFTGIWLKKKAYKYLQQTDPSALNHLPKLLL